MHFQKFKITLFVSFFLLTLSGAIKSKNTLFGGNLSLKLGISGLNSISENQISLIPISYGSATYKLNKYIETGIYLGYGNFKHKDDLSYNETTGMYEWYSIDSTSHMGSSGGESYSSSKVVRYGLVTEVHLLPLFFEKDMRIDISITPQLGVLKENHDVLEDYRRTIWSEPFFEYGLGIGTKYNFSRQLGVFSEIAIGRFYHNDNIRVKLGLSFNI